MAFNVNMLTSYDVEMVRAKLYYPLCAHTWNAAADAAAPPRRPSCARRSATLTSTVQRTTLCVSRAAHCALRVRNMGRAEEGQGSNSTDMLSKVKLTGIEVAEPHEKAPACMAV